ncbi:MAG: GNAT family N-acetyltransferase [Actinobacteria bacterium]|nr:GNAT family N-acetyltransferase [Actinomycetota bacterium]
MATPPPPPAAGAAWRPIAADDIGALAVLARAVHDAERLDFAGGPEFWAWWLGRHDPETDTIAAAAPDGALLACGGSYHSDTEAGARAILWFDAHPDRLDLEGPVMEWAISRGREQIAGSAHPDGAVVRIAVEEHRERRRRLLEGAGFAAARSFVDMERPLDRPPERPPLPDGIEIVPWTGEWDEAARLASNAAFADHWGSLPMDPETWSGMVMDTIVRRDCSFLAVAGGEVAGFCLTEVDPEEDEHRLWVDRVGTRPEWRRRHLASALLTEALRAGAAAGLATSGLAVDEESAFDATALYTRLGYTVGTRSISYVLEWT